MPENSIADKLKSWAALAEAMKPRIEELAHLREEQAELESIVQEIEVLGTQEDLHTARLRETIRKRQDAERRGVELKGRLAAGLQAHFGKRSPVLREFGLRPLGTPRRKPEEEPAPEATTRAADAGAA